MIDYRNLLAALPDTMARHWCKTLSADLETALQPEQHGHLNQWQSLLDSLPQIATKSISLNRDVVTIGHPEEATSAQHKQLLATLKTLMPWRKGPYELFGHHIDTEWRSDLKWKRLASGVTPLDDRLVLDVGCGSGYHCWRMLGAGAGRVIGIDPTLLFVHQFAIFKHFLPDAPVDVLPFGLEQLPRNLQAFDSVFSMGVLYHRRSPIDHLLELRDCLRPGGELVLETLIVDGSVGYSLVPESRYAGMRNVWFIPSHPTLEQWLKRCGFDHIQCIDECVTTPIEQRATDWMTGRSLIDSLNPQNTAETIEGHPAPKRVTYIAKRC